LLRTLAQEDFPVDGGIILEVFKKKRKTTSKKMCGRTNGAARGVVSIREV
jgi:hypothetical protein